MAGFHLTPFDVGQVKAHVEHGLSASSIADRMLKPDGKTKFGPTAIQNCINKLHEDPEWRGEREEGSDRPRKTSTKQDREMVRWLLKERGKQKVSVPRLKKQFAYLRKLSNTLVEERLFEANLHYLRRRKKAIVTKGYLRDRVAYCHDVKRKRETTLEKWAYTDGTVYYLDRDAVEAENSKRRALGTHVWRRPTNKDAMYQDCLGPSSYSKGQGIPVKVWGLLACGVLHIHVLDHGVSMDRYVYAELVEDKFDQWRGNCEHVVCDHERCLRTEDVVLALETAGLKLVDFPKCSQDFNAIENAWAILRERLDETQPVALESREEFVKRFFAAVRWANRDRAEQLWKLSTNQKERADLCLAQKPPGGRTKF